MAWITGPARPRLCSARSSRDVRPRSVASWPSASGETQWSRAATVACQPPPKASPQPTTSRLVVTRTGNVSIVVRGRPANSGGGAQWSMGMRSASASIRSMVIAGMLRLFAPHEANFGKFAEAQPVTQPCLRLKPRPHDSELLSLAIGEPRVKRSPSRRALRIDVERIERVARGHEQPVALDTAEAEIGAALGQRDEADGFTGRVENLHSVQLRAAHAPAAPQIAVDVAAQAVGVAIRLGG